MFLTGSLYEVKKPLQEYVGSRKWNLNKVFKQYFEKYFRKKCYTEVIIL